MSDNYVHEIDDAPLPLLPPHKTPLLAHTNSNTNGGAGMDQCPTINPEGGAMARPECAVGDPRFKED